MSVFTFTDGTGRQWEIESSLLTWERVKSETGVDMLTISTTQECLRQIDDPYTLGRVLFEAVAEQAASLGVSGDQFKRVVTADNLDEAANALIEAAIFFCRSRLRPALTMAFKKARERQEREIARIEKSLPDLERRMEQALESTETSTASVTSSAGSSASTPADGPSATCSGRSRAGRNPRGTTRAR